MPNFTVKLYHEAWAKQRVGKLFRDGKCLLDEFIDEIKQDKNLDPELGDLFAIIKWVADGTNPKPPKQKYNKLNLGKKLPYNGYEAKSSHLRMYLFHDDETGYILVIGGKKGDQDEDLKHLKKIIKEFDDFKKEQKDHDKQ